MKFSTLPHGLFAYLLSLLGFVALGTTTYLLAFGGSVVLTAIVGVLCVALFVASASAFRVQVRQSPHGGPGSALLASTSAEEEERIRALVAERRDRSRAPDPSIASAHAAIH